MKNIIEPLLKDTLHRPWPLPAERWRYYQEWNDALFLHWEVDYEVLRKLVPEGLQIDRLEGKCYVSLVVFTMQKIRPRNLPSVKFISDFHEINLRTYVEQDSKKGVYFISIEAEKLLSAIVARSLSGLPYEKSVIKRNDTKLTAAHPNRNFRIDASYTINENIQQKTSLDQWLTERYCLYLAPKDYYRYEVHHREWELKQVQLDKLQLRYQLEGLTLSEENIVAAHYSKGVEVVAWGRKKI
jgi:uncharacterized protein YqjF (DUF2071 family)